MTESGIQVHRPAAILRGILGHAPQENLDFHIFLEQFWCILSTDVTCYEKRDQMW